MISLELARALAVSGLRWSPRSGDAFAIPDAELDGEVFVISELTIEPRSFSSGTVLAFNGTTEWALDQVAAEDALWLPREDQLRELLGAAFRSLTVVDGELVVTIVAAGREAAHRAPAAADAYASALLQLLEDALR